MEQKEVRFLEKSVPLSGVSFFRRSSSNEDAAAKRRMSFDDSVEILKIVSQSGLEVKFDSKRSICTIKKNVITL